MNRQSVLVIWKSNPKLFITWTAIGIVMILFIFPPPCFSPNNVDHGLGPTPESSEAHTLRVLNCDELRKYDLNMAEVTVSFLRSDGGYLFRV